MRVLIACEFSATVRDAFRARGHDAWSCDLLPCEGDPAWHIQGDALAAAHGQQWDLMIAHPPCTHLAVSGARWFKDKREEQAQALAFVRDLLAAPIPRIALENPVSIISSRIRKPDWIVQPHQFGHDASKATCLWLKRLPPLRPTAHVAPRIVNGRPRWANQTDSGQNKLAPSADRWALRSKTYQGIADAMADQWGNL
jgi:site-specific DNA-cytosine methylase